MKKSLFSIIFLLMGFYAAYSQEKITGIVKDAETGEAMSYVSVIVKGTKVATNSDINGSFTITAPSTGTLLFSFIGYEDVEVPINGRKEINVSMKTSSTILDEAVVIGMTSVDRRLFTGASDHISADAAKLNGIADVSRALEGRSAGVSVQNVSGTFGTAPKIRVRGATSIYGSSKPLWVVDGIVMEDVAEIDADALSSGDAETLISSAIAGLNSDDIESFEILKDGSATSIYGARAMPGVIVITTKKGKSGQSNLSYNGEYTVRLVPVYSEFNIMNSQEQMGVYQEMQQKGWLNYSNTFRDKESGIYGKMYQLINTYDKTSGTFGIPHTEEAKNNYLRQAEMRNTDWFNELFNLNLMQSHSVSLSGGNDKSNYYVSLSGLLDPGWTVASSVNRYTANLNTTYNISKKLSFGIISNASYRKQKAPGTLSQSTDVVSGEVKRDFDINPYSYALNTSRTMSPNEYYTRNYAPFNILHELENNYMDINTTDLKFQGELKWKVLRNLELSAIGAIKYSNAAIEHHVKDDSNQATAYRTMPDAIIRDKNPYLYTDPDVTYALPIVILPEGGIYERSDNRMEGYDFRTTFKWNQSFNKIHTVSLFGGMEISSVDREKSWFRGWGRQYSMGDIAYYAYQMFKKGQEENSQYFTASSSHGRNAAFFAMGTYSYKSKYIFNGTARYEGSNKLGKSRSARWLPTWNLSGMWNLHEENFFKTVQHVLSHASVRASYSLTADRGPAWLSNSQAIIKSVTPWRPSTTVKETAMELSDLENSELTYEKKYEWNFGADIGFLNNRINLNTDIYFRNNFDLIGATTTTGIGGEVDKYANVATMKSHGFELSISTKNIETQDFSWTTNFIFSYCKVEITKLDSRKRVIDLITGSGFGMTGYPHRAIFSIPFVGLTEDGLPVFINENGERTTTGINFQEVEKIGFLKYEGSAEPTHFGSLGNIFTYKNFRLNIFISYSFGNKVRLAPAFRAAYSDMRSMPKEFKNRWILPGDEAYTNIPVLISTRQYNDISHLSYAYNAYNYSTERIADGGFIRMKEISLSYDFPKNWINSLGIKSLSAKIQTTNLFLLYADKKLNGQDPEFFLSGGVAVPMPKQFTFTLKLGL